MLLVHDIKEEIANHCVYQNQYIVSSYVITAEGRRERRIKSDGLMDCLLVVYNQQ